MKSKLLNIIILFTLLFASCSRENKPEFFTFQFDKHATLIIKNIQPDDEYSVVGRYATFLSTDYINNSKSTEKALKNNNGEYVLNFNISAPSDVYLKVNEDLQIPLFLIPGDTLYMTLDLSDSSNILKRIKFEGKSASINEYKVMRRERFGVRYLEKCARIVRANLPVMVMQDSLDSISLVEMDFLNEYSNNNSIPKWYLNFAGNQIIYTTADYKCYYLNSRKWQKIEAEEPNNYLKFLDEIKINNDEVLISPYYYYFLKEYFELSNPDSIYKMNVTERRKILGIHALKNAERILSGEVKDVYNTFIISQFIIDIGEYKLAEEIINDPQRDIVSSKYRNYLVKYLEDKSSLKPGMKAPAFYLLNSNNQYEYLDSYKGNVILLNFWYPGCKPCVNEIPFEKELVNEFKNEKFKLINICLFNTEESWRNAINKLGMEGINLFADKNWEDKLIKEYNTARFPHYTLIDKNGNIVSNNPSRPSDGVSEEILKLLAK